MSKSANGLIAKLRSILVYEETDQYITAAAAFDGRFQAAKHLLWNPVIYSVLPERRYEIEVEDHAFLTRRIWVWRGRRVAFGEWKAYEFDD